MAQVLVVEPDATLRAAPRDLLAGLDGHAVATVATGRDAAVYLARHPDPQVVLLDAALPGPLGAEGVLLLAARQHLPRHAYVLLARGAPDALPFGLRVLCDVLAVPVAALPAAADRRDLFARVAAAERPRAPLRVPAAVAS